MKNITTTEPTQFQTRYHVQVFLPGMNARYTTWAYCPTESIAKEFARGYSETFRRSGGEMSRTRVIDGGNLTVLAVYECGKAQPLEFNL